MRQVVARSMACRVLGNTTRIPDRGVTQPSACTKDTVKFVFFVVRAMRAHTYIPIRSQGARSLYHDVAWDPWSWDSSAVGVPVKVCEYFVW